MKSIGKTLRKAREKKGLSLEEAASQTRIHHNVLRDLEDGNFHLLPSPAYVKGFLKRYAEYLGLPSAALIDQYLSTHPQEPEQILVLKGKELPRLPLDKFIIVGTLVLILAIILTSGFFVFRALRLRKSVRPAQTSEPTVSSALTEPADVKKSIPTPLVSVKKVSGPLRLEIFAEEDSWLEVRCNGKLLFQGVLPKGSREIWQGEDKIRLQIGDAGALRLNLNGNPLGKLGREGEILREVVLTKEGIELNPKSR